MIVAVPTLTPVTTPTVPMAFETVATACGVLVHATCVVTSRVVMSEKRPVAVSATVVPTGIDAIAGMIVIDTSVAGDTVTIA